MNVYEIVLVCPFCSQERSLGTVEAETRHDARIAAEVRWPDARYEEMIPRRVESMQSREVSPVVRN